MPVEDVRRFEQEFLEHLRRRGVALGSIRESGQLSDDTAEALEREIDAFSRNFLAGTTGDQGPSEGREEALGDEGVEQEQIVRQRR